MSLADRTRWDDVFRQRLNTPFPDPDPLLLQFVPPTDPDDGLQALDLACGFGQNGLWLAESGYHVDLLDISRVALNRARQEMSIRNIRNVNLLQVDIDELRLEPNHYDVLCVFRYLKRGLFPLMKLATKPGGRVIYETYNMRYLDVLPGFNTAFLLNVGELVTFFNDWQILHEEENDHNSRLVAIKPM